jgi:hypothetical protein
MSRIQPALSDGRLTNYLSRCELNSEIMRHFNLSSENEYRLFLQSKPEVVQQFLAQNFNGVLPYYAVTPCVSSREAYRVTPRPR